MNKKINRTEYGIQDIYNDPDLKMIIDSRVLPRFKKACIEICNKAEGKQREEKIEAFHNLMDKILEIEIEAFKNEFNVYNEKFSKYKTDIFTDVEEARKSSIPALSRLLHWDRTWLKVAWATNIILEAQNHGDHESLKRIGDAISKRPLCDTMPKRREIIEKLKPVIDACYFDNHEMKKIIESLHLDLCERGEIDEDLTDIDYFKKLLRRHKVIKNQT